MSRALVETGLMWEPSYTEDSADFWEAVAGDGDATVDRRVEAEVVAAGFARGDGADAV